MWSLFEAVDKEASKLLSHNKPQSKQPAPAAESLEPPLKMAEDAHGATFGAAGSERPDSSQTAASGRIAGTLHDLKDLAQSTQRLGLGLLAWLREEGEAAEALAPPEGTEGLHLPWSCLSCLFRPFLARPGFFFEVFTRTPSSAAHHDHRACASRRVGGGPGAPRYRLRCRPLRLARVAASPCGRGGGCGRPRGAASDAA